MRAFFNYAIFAVGFSQLCIAEENSSPLAALKLFEGRWTIKGMEATYSEVCTWLPGERYLECRSEDKSTTPHEFGTSVLGFSEQDQVYTYQSLGASTRQMRGMMEGGVWRFFGQSERGPEWRRWQIVIKPTETGFHFQEQVSVRGGPWKEAVVLDYIRIKN